MVAFSALEWTPHRHDRVDWHSEELLEIFGGKKRLIWNHVMWKSSRRRAVRVWERRRRVCACVYQEGRGCVWVFVWVWWSHQLCAPPPLALGPQPWAPGPRSQTDKLPFISSNYAPSTEYFQWEFLAFLRCCLYVVAIDSIVSFWGTSTAELINCYHFCRISY